MKAEFSDNQQKDGRTFGEDRSYKLTMLLCWVVCIGFALIEAWSQRQFINEDGISYLDMSDWLLRHNWHLLVNPVWSPLYPILIGVVTWLVRPSAQWEVPLVHILNLVIFLAALAAFEFLLRRVIGAFRQESTQEEAGLAAPLPVWTWQLLAYSLFAWSTIGMIWGPRFVTPDLCVAMLVYLDCGLLFDLRTSTKRSRTCMMLGLTLGLGYLAKAVLFPMAFLFMLVAFFVIGEWRKAVRPLAIIFLVFCAVSAPLFIAMSKRVGRPSFSETGNLNYAWVVNRVGGAKLAGGPFFRPASGPPPGFKHPMTLLHTHPDVYGFREPLALTYPPRQDGGYWSAGASTVVDLRAQLRAMAKNLAFPFRYPHIDPMLGLIAVGLIFILISRNSLRRFNNVLRSWPLLVPGVAALGLYLLVWVEPRYVAPFLLLVLLGLFPGILLQNPRSAAKRVTISTVVIAITLTVLTGLLVAYHLAGFPRTEPSKGGLYVRVGTSLNKAGVPPEEEVGLIGDSSDGSRWARLARVRIVAQILREDTGDFWRISNPREKAEVYDAFARFGAKAIVAEETPPSVGFGDWQRLGDTHYYVHLLALAGSN
jgi:hypothetical protein